MTNTIRAQTASDVQRLRSVLAVKLIKNNDLYTVCVRQKDGGTTELECIPRTEDHRSVTLVVPGVTRMTVSWEDLLSIVPMPARDEDEITDRPHPFSASDLPFVG